MTDGQRLGIIIDGVDIFEKWGINVKDRDIGKPNKKKALESVAHSSKVLDFSELYGGMNVEERVLKYVLNIIGSNHDRVSTEFLETEFNNFLMRKQELKLEDEIFPGYYFLAEVRDGPDFSRIFTAGELTVTFDAYGFRIKKVSEGSPYWDDYTILDYYQEVKYNVNGTKTIELMNNGANRISPTVKLSSNMTISKNGMTFSGKSGIFKDKDFVLDVGMNTINVTGNGTIEFDWHKELI